MGKKSGFGINIPDHISESLETTFKYLNFLLRMRILDQGIFLTLDSGSGKEKLGSGINITDPQHWSKE
jgi:hypothetical protein